MGQSLEKVVQLEAAIRRGDNALPEVKELLKAGVSVNSMHGPKSVLYFAIEHDKASAAELLLDLGADVKKGYFTETPLHCAASRGNVQIVSKLLEKGAKVNAKNHNRCTPLWLAASEGHYDVVHLLLQQPRVDVDRPCGDTFLKRSFNSSPLSQAVIQDHFDIAKELLAKGADANLADINGHTPLHHACSAGNHGLVKLLVQHGCSLNCVDKKGYTPLHTAADRNHLSAVKTLLAAGCDANIPCSDFSRFTALHFAAYGGYADVADVLCSVDGVQIDARAIFSETPLALACKSGNPFTMNQLMTRCGNLTFLFGHVIRGLWQGRYVPEDDEDLERYLARLLFRENCESGGNCVSEEISSGEQSGVEASSVHSVTPTSSHANGNECQSITDQFNSTEGLVYSMFRSLFPGQQNYHFDVMHVLISRGADLLDQIPIDIALKRCVLQYLLLLMCHGASMDVEWLSENLSLKRPKMWKHWMLYPFVLALVCSSVRHHRFLNACMVRSPSHDLVTDLPLYVKEVLEQPLSLTRLCRSEVRRILAQKTSRSIAPLVDKLPLPYAIKQFLLLSDVLQKMRDLKQAGKNKT